MIQSLRAVVEKLQNGTPWLNLSGLAPGGKPYLIAELIKADRSRTYLYLATTGREAAQFERDLSFFLGSSEEIALFPALDVLPFSPLSPHADITCSRLAILHRLLTRPSRFLAATIPALLSALPPRTILENPITLETGMEVDRDLFLKNLVEWGYQNVPVSIDRGNFSIRGSIIDLYDAGASDPHRIEWLGDTIESIRTFDPRSQRSLKTIEKIAILPARPILLTEETIENFSKKARARGEDRDVPRSQWTPLVEKVKERIAFSGIETYLPLFYEQPSTFWDWLPKETVLIADDFKALSPVIADFLQDIGTLIQGKPTLLTLEEALPGLVSFEKRLKDHPRLSFSLAVPIERAETLSIPMETHEAIRQEIQQSRKGLEPLRPLARRLEKWLETDRVTLVASSKHQVDRLTDLLTPYLSTLPPFAIGNLSGGFRLPEDQITFVTDEEIFGPKVRIRPKEAMTGETLSSFAELKKGDPIIHRDHGIGIYQGLLHMTIDGTGNDFLLIEYRDGDKLYLPAYRMNLVQRYTGANGKMPTPDKLGGTAWAKVKGKSEKMIQKLAGELLNLYAARTAGQGFAFSPPNDLFEAFEASFPYEETPDQEAAIQDVLNDMQKDLPMDRLVLGDVGYGKTEVALRAAYKAALDGKQVIFLVPTTLLAFQHYERFIERFRDTPVTVEMLSRFRSAAEQKEVVRKLGIGKIDIVIGTHRLLQPDISFKDLGLLIIDEEHRFGVAQKEKIKRLKKNVDVLALSATPIPRSLYMSLVGIRPVSVIETPPTDRLAIRTYVMSFEDEAIREAILRELRRGGQVFFVHNQVETIGKMKDFLSKLVPEAKIEIGHGQMEEQELEDVMIRFSHQKFNVLLCTTIIESGIDIPTANTIFLNNADRFGLAQIYQLRGRVGRGNHRAYAYLIIPEEKALTPEATKRLEVLQRFSDLGSGYRMASYDLEIRGAGNLLGQEQSGSMNAIGYELYTELLEKAVKELKGETVLDEIDPELHFKIPAYLPEDYIPDPPVRLELYRRLASGNEEEIESIADELADRFGKPTLEVAHLLELSMLKTLAKKLRIKQIRYDGRTFVYAFDPSSALPPELLTARITKEPKKYRMTPDFRFFVQEKTAQPELSLIVAKKFLRELLLHVSS